MTLYRALTVAVFAVVMTGAMQAPPAREPAAQLTVRGRAELDRPADQLNIRIGAVTESEEATEAIHRNNDRMNKVVSAIRKVGLTDKEYQTGTFSVQPTYSQRPPRSSDRSWTPRITGYRVSNNLTIKTKQLDKAGDLIQAVAEAGANTIDSINFDLADTRKHRSEAIGAATANALADARTLADAAGVRLVRIVSLTLDEAGVRPVFTQQGRMGLAMEARSAPPIVPGDVTVRASVTVVYEITG